MPDLLIPPGLTGRAIVPIPGSLRVSDEDVKSRAGIQGSGSLSLEAPSWNPVSGPGVPSSDWTELTGGLGLGAAANASISSFLGSESVLSGGTASGGTGDVDLSFLNGYRRMRPSSDMPIDWGSDLGAISGKPSAAGSAPQSFHSSAAHASKLPLFGQSDALGVGDTGIFGASRDSSGHHSSSMTGGNGGLGNGSLGGGGLRSGLGGLGGGSSSNFGGLGNTSISASHSSLGNKGLGVGVLPRGASLDVGPYDANHIAPAHDEIEAALNVLVRRDKANLREAEARAREAEARAVARERQASERIAQLGESAAAAGEREAAIGAALREHNALAEARLRESNSRAAKAEEAAAKADAELKAYMREAEASRKQLLKNSEKFRTTADAAVARAEHLSGELEMANLRELELNSFIKEARAAEKLASESLRSVNAAFEKASDANEKLTKEAISHRERADALEKRVSVAEKERKKNESLAEKERRKLDAAEKKQEAEDRAAEIAARDAIIASLKNLVAAAISDCAVAKSDAVTASGDRDVALAALASRDEALVDVRTSNKKFLDALIAAHEAFSGLATSFHHFFKNDERQEVANAFNIFSAQVLKIAAIAGIRSEPPAVDAAHVPADMPSLRVILGPDAAALVAARFTTLSTPPSTIEALRVALAVDIAAPSSGDDARFTIPGILSLPSHLPEPVKAEATVADDDVNDDDVQPLSMNAVSAAMQPSLYTDAAPSQPSDLDASSISENATPGDARASNNETTGSSTTSRLVAGDEHAAATPDAYFDDPLRLPYVSIAYIENDDEACLKRLRGIVQHGCPVDQTRDLKTLLYCTASGKMRCVSFLMDQGVHFADSTACMRVSALAVRYAIESWANIDNQKAREEMAWREKQGVALLRRGCPLFLADEAPSASQPGGPPSNRMMDPVYRYDPERAKYADADFDAPVAVILGIKEKAPAASSNRRFASWKVTAKQKVANEIYIAWLEAFKAAAGKK
jgi:hypothetical protein